jgi:hypothetical protein
MEQSRDPHQIVQPNHFELACDGVTITYSTSSKDGRAVLSIARRDQTQSFRGDEIRVADSEIGQLVTVTLESIPDLQVVTFTLLIPPVNLERNEASIKTETILTTHRTSIGGPALVKGQLLTYSTSTVSGLAKAVIF